MPHCFTVQATGLLRELVSPCDISPAFDPLGTHLPYHRFQAIWDTGATNSVINQRVVDECGLKPIGMARVHNANATHDCEVFLVNIALPNAVGFSAHKVTKQQLQSAEVLIGMDIIGLGDFAVTNKDGKTAFSFRFPSTECIDFVKAKPVVAPVIQGRNALCACGSGKKFKHCCGDPRNRATTSN